MPLTTKEGICKTCGSDRNTTPCPDCSSYRAPEFSRKQILAIPIGNYNGFNRYDTDDEFVLHLWDKGTSFDIRIPKQNGSGAARGAEKAEQASGKADNTDAVHSKLHEETGLSPCPFCGGTNVRIESPHGREPHVAICVNSQESKGCGASSCWELTRKDAIRKWNKRAPLTATTDFDAPGYSVHHRSCPYEHGGACTCNKEDLEGATRTPQGQPSEQTGEDKEYKVVRFRDGKQMAEGGSVWAKSEDEALEKGRDLFHDCPWDAFRVSLISSHEPKSTVEGENKISASPTLTEGKEEPVTPKKKHEWSKGLGSPGNPQVGFVPECIHCGISADDWEAADKQCSNAPIPALPEKEKIL